MRNENGRRCIPPPQADQMMRELICCRIKDVKPYYNSREFRWKLRFGQEASRRGGDAVARGVLDEVHGLVGEMEEAGLIARVHGKRSDADAGSDAHVEAFVLEPGGVFNHAVK